VSLTQPSRKHDTSTAGSTKVTFR